MNNLELLQVIRDTVQASATLLDLSGKGLTTLPSEIGQLTSLNELDLSGNRLKILPPEIGQMTNLNELYLSSNELTTLPIEIGQLTNLNELDLSRNQLITLLPEVFRLFHLEKLNLRSNHLTTLLPQIIQLTHLRELDLRSNQLTTLPSTIGQLTQLKKLYLSHNQLTTLIPEIGQLVNLNELSLRSNRLTTLPSEIGQLTKLTILHLSSNRLTTLPSEIGQLTKLTILHLSSNRLTTLPLEIGRLRLVQLTLDGNFLTSLPPEIRQQEPSAVLNFYKQQLEQATDRLYEAKLLIVGEPGAGKTTLARKIQDLNYMLKSDETSTEGIDIIQWNFRIENGKNFRVNIWDFGGQEIYHATHQFFLTKRSLYVLVADTRKEDTDFYYWLNVVELLSNNSPLLIVKNEKQDRQREINERQLRGRFTNLKETLPTNLANNRGLQEVLTTIKRYIGDLQHVGIELPKGWINVREALERNPQNYITQEKYLEICQENGFTELEDKLQLSSYLHDLGVCLHFQKDDLLCKTVILKQSWGADAVYKVLDNPRVIQNLGKFDRADLAKIWHEEKYTSVQAELLRLMMNFRLCYEIPSRPGIFVAPQLLSPDQPDYRWDKVDNLLLRYEYEFMPKGIVTRFIVETHPWIEGQTCVWKSGVVLNKEQARAEIIEHYHKGAIHVRVSGRRKRDLLVTVMHELKKINSSYERLEYKELVPCNCAACKDSQIPEFYTLQLLYKYQDDERDYIECRNSYERVNVQTLLNDIIPEQIQSEHRDSIEQAVTKGEHQTPTLALHVNINNANQQEQAVTKDNTYNQYGNRVQSDKVMGDQVGGDKVGGDKVMADKVTNYNSQNLAQAAKDIKSLLDQLSQDYPNDSKEILGAKAVNRLENNPTLKQRVVNALKEVGTTVLEEAVDHPAIKTVIAGVKGFIDV